MMSLRGRTRIPTDQFNGSIAWCLLSETRGFALTGALPDKCDGPCTDGT